MLALTVQQTVFGEIGKHFMRTGTALLAIIRIVQQSAAYLQRTGYPRKIIDVAGMVIESLIQISESALDPLTQLLAPLHH